MTAGARPPRRAFAALVAVGLALTSCSDDERPTGGTDARPAFDTELAGLSSSAPVKEGSFVTFGSVALRNTSRRPVTLVRAEPVWSEHAQISNIGISPYGPTTPISAQDFVAVDARPIGGFVVPPSGAANEGLYGITIEVRLDPGEEAGIVLGMDVEYLVDGDTRVQRFPLMNLVCPWIGDAGQPCPSTYQGIEVLNADAQELLETVAGVQTRSD